MGEGEAELSKGKSLWSNTLQEVKTKQLSNKVPPPAAAVASPSTPSQQSSLWSEEKQKEFESKSQSVRLIKRIHRKLNSKLRNYFFYFWKFFILQKKNLEFFELEWKSYETKHWEEIHRKEMELSAQYKELLELKDQEIEAMKEKQQQLLKQLEQEREQEEDNVTKGERGRRRSEDEGEERERQELIKEKEQRIRELEEENEEVKRLEMKTKNEIELRYLEELRGMQERFQFLEQEGREERLRNDQKIFLLRCERSNQKRSEFNVKYGLQKWKRFVEAMRERVKRKQLKERQLHRFDPPSPLPFFTLDRLLRLLDSNSTRRSVTKAFYQWNKLIFLSLVPPPSSSSSSSSHLSSNQALITSLQSQILSLKEELFLFTSYDNSLHSSSSSSSPSSGATKMMTLTSLTSQLHAERILNRELISTNLDLQNKLINTENRLVEILKVYPPQQRKQLVCEVLMERENEIMRLRKENRSLKEQIRRLEGIMREIGRDHEGRGKGKDKRRGGERERREERKDRSEKDESQRSKGQRDLKERNVKRGRWRREREEEGEEEAEEEEDGEEEDHEGEEESEEYFHETRELNKKDALKIIVKELRKLQQQNHDDKQIKQSLTSHLCEETSRYQQQSLALQSLQQNAINLEKKYQQMVELLVKRYDQKEIFPLLEMVEKGITESDELATGGKIIRKMKSEGREI
jgi:hypothetical protein